MKKSTIDHKIRLKLGLTCDQYVLLDYIASTGKNIISVENIKQNIGFDQINTQLYISELIDLDLISLNNGNIRVTDACKAYFNNNNFAQEVIDYFNFRTNSSLSLTSDCKRLINARLNEGDYSLEDFKLVVDSKTKEWQKTEQERYLRPSTLFNGKNFQGYLNYSKKEAISCVDRKMIM